VDHPTTRGYFSQTEGQLELSVWDFAGQHDYYHSHHHFLSLRSVYLILWSLIAPDGEESLSFWVKSLAAHLKGLESHYSIFVVGTHADRDEASGQNRAERDSKIKKLFQQRGLQFDGYFEVSCVDRLEQIDALQDIVFGTILSHSYMGERVPSSYLRLEEKVLEFRNTQSTFPIRRLDEFSGLVPDRTTLIRALELLSQWGICSYFKEDHLSDIVVVDPQFLTKQTMAGFFRLDKEAEEIRERGIIPKNKLKVFWPEIGNLPNFEKISEQVVALMEKFEVCFTFERIDDQEKPEDCLMFPGLLPEFDPENDRRFRFFWPKDPQADEYIFIERVIKCNMVPIEMASRMIVRFHDKIFWECVWKDRVILQTKESTRAMILVEKEENCLEVQVRSSNYADALQLMGEIFDTIEKVAELFPGVEKEEKIRNPFVPQAYISLDFLENTTDDLFYCEETLQGCDMSILRQKAGLEQPHESIPESLSTFFPSFFPFSIEQLPSPFSSLPS